VLEEMQKENESHTRHGASHVGHHGERNGVKLGNGERRAANLARTAGNSLATWLFLVIMVVATTFFLPSPWVFTSSQPENAESDSINLACAANAALPRPIEIVELDVCAWVLDFAFQWL
jgi:hypothetical protein